MEEGGKIPEKDHPITDHLSIEITAEDNSDLLTSIKQKIDSIPPSHYVKRVPEQLSSGHFDKYYPSFVSIGPLHHGKDNLKPMEDTKWLYLNRLLSRKPNTEASIDNCIRAMRPLEHKARKFYGETIHMGSNEFVEMMLVDCGFVIELFLEYMFRNLRRRDDPFFAPDESLFRLRCDLILFENQVPFVILDRLFQLVPYPKNYRRMSLIELALNFFIKLIPQDLPRVSMETFGPETHHLLDLMRQFYVPTIPQVKSGGGRGGQIELSHATQLTNLGIRVRKSMSENPFNVRFFEGKVKVPYLDIHEYMEILFRNLMAMEICEPGCSKNVTSYVVLMGRLIQSKKDARLLYDEGILSNIDGHKRDEDIVSLFKSLNVDLNLKSEDFYYRGLCEEINDYQAKKGRACWENMRCYYYRSHLGLVGCSLAILVLVFVFTGTLFSALTFLLHHFQ